MTPPEYDVANVPVGGRDSHGGIAVLYQQGFNVVSKSDNTDRYFTSFEYCFIVFTCGSKCFTVVTRPYPSAKNQLTTGMLLNEFSQFMQDLTIAKGDLVCLIVGDLNLHLDIHNDLGTQKFGELMTTLGLEQSVTGPTHRCGHTLDVVITLMSLILFQITLLLHVLFVLGSLLIQEL